MVGGCTDDCCDFVDRVNFTFLSINSFQVLNYMTERMRQIGAINKFYEKTVGKETPQIGVYSEADIPRAMLSREFVFVLSVKVLPNLVEDEYEKFTIEKRTNYWYNNMNVVGEIR